MYFILSQIVLYKLSLFDAVYTFPVHNAHIVHYSRHGRTYLKKTYGTLKMSTHYIELRY